MEMIAGTIRKMMISLTCLIRRTGMIEKITGVIKMMVMTEET